MAKTIKEMAELSAHEYSKHCGDVTTMEKISYVHGYGAGANDVLEIIEKELPKSDKCLNYYGKALLWRINERIKGLKRE